MSTFLQLTAFQTGDLASQAGLLATSGALQAQINAGGGGTSNAVFKTGDQSITGTKTFTQGLSTPAGAATSAGTVFDHSWTGTFGFGPNARVGSINSIFQYDFASGSPQSVGAGGIFGIRSFVGASTLYTGNVYNVSNVIIEAPSVSNNSCVANHRSLWVRGTATQRAIKDTFGLFIETFNNTGNSVFGSGANYAIFSQGNASVFSGSIGIGAVGTGADPSAALHVNGTSILSGNAYASGDFISPLFRTLTAGSAVHIYNGTDASITGIILTNSQGGGNVRFGSASKHNVYLTTNNIRWAHLDSDGHFALGNSQVFSANPGVSLNVSGSTALAKLGGNVSIGAITSPSATLHVTGTTRLDLATTTSANAGEATLPANPVGFITINITGGNFKVPYYNV